MMQGTILDDLAASVGYTATRAIVTWWAGRTLYVPAQLRPGHPLASIIGEPALRALVRDFGSEILKIPSDAQDGRFRRDRSICERYCEGWTTHRVADEFDISVRRAEQIRAELVERGWMDFARGRAIPTDVMTAGDQP